jgi:hypothetical protein
MRLMLSNHYQECNSFKKSRYFSQKHSLLRVLSRIWEVRPSIINVVITACILKAKARIENQRQGAAQPSDLLSRRLNLTDLPEAVDEGLYDEHLGAINEW